MDLSPMQLVASVFGGGAGGSAVTKVIEILSRRRSSQAYTMGAVDHAVQTAMGSVTGQLERTEARLEIVEAQHEDCQRNLQSVRTDLDASRQQYDRERAELKAEIARLMAGPVATYRSTPMPKPRSET
jgi:chromosome segregation ATPase